MIKLEKNTMSSTLENDFSCINTHQEATKTKELCN